jgi:hypothetical protein
MFSAVIQLVLAAMVIMPPGAYRTMQSLASGACSGYSEGTGDCARQFSRPRLLADEAPVPVRGRNWCQKIFTCEKPSHGKSLDCEGPAPDWLVAVENPDSRPYASTQCRSSAMTSRCSPRSALFALHELLI